MKNEEMKIIRLIIIYSLAEETIALKHDLHPRPILKNGSAIMSATAEQLTVNVVYFLTLYYWITGL